MENSIKIECKLRVRKNYIDESIFNVFVDFKCDEYKINESMLIFESLYWNKNDFDNILDALKDSIKNDIKDSIKNYIREELENRKMNSELENYIKNIDGKTIDIIYDKKEFEK